MERRSCGAAVPLSGAVTALHTGGVSKNGRPEAADQHAHSTPRRTFWGSALRLVVALVVLGLVGVLGPTVAVRSVALGRLHTSIADVPAHDVALVLGAGLEPDGVTPSPFLRARLDLAAELYASGKIKVLLLSGDNGQRYYNEPEAMRKYLVEQRGVPAKHLVLDHAGFNTWSSCVRAKEIFGVDSLLVVTQSYHLPRAVTACRWAGIDAHGLGDESVKDRFPSVWQHGELREVGANIKLVVDKTRNARPALGPKEDGVQKALKNR